MLKKNTHTSGVISELSIFTSFQETLERLEECSGNAASQSEIIVPSTYVPVFPPTSNRTERPVWSAPRRYPRSPSPLAQPLPQSLPASPLRPVSSPARSPAHSPGSSPRAFSPIRKVCPPVGIPPSRLPVEVEGLDASEQTPSQHWHVLMLVFTLWYVKYCAWVVQHCSVSHCHQNNDFHSCHSTSVFLIFLWLCT